MPPTTSQAAPARVCDAASPTGLYKGEATSAHAGKLDVTLDLHCDSGRYAGVLLTPIGRFNVSAAELSATNLTVTFGTGDGAIVTKFVLHGTELSGTYSTSGDSGPITLQRTAASAAGDLTSANLAISPGERQQDLKFFAQQIVASHGAPFHQVSRAQFDRAVAALSTSIGTISSDAFYIGLDRLATMIGDAHTFVRIPPDSAQMPLLIRRFGSDYRVVAATDGYQRALGGKIIAIEGVPIARAARLSLWPTPAGETDAFRKDRIADFLSVGMMLHGLGITPKRDVITYRLRFDDGLTASLAMYSLPTGADVKWNHAAAKTPLYRQHDGEPFWCVALQQGETIYCNFNGYDDLASRSSQLVDLLRARTARRVIIDMRLNGGGDFTVAKKYVVDPLAASPTINRRGGLYVLIGRATFSAGMSNAAQFKWQTHAILVGEPIGERPNSWQEPRQFTLPNSHLVVRYSTKFYKFAPPGVNVIAPSVYVAPSWREYAKGKDPVLEWVLRQPLP